ncbi:MAG TPA: HDOD domain-containing protein [Candidatus Acidoferrum sp.]
MFERFISRHAIFKDNLTLLGYDLRFRAEGGVTPESSPAAYAIDSATMVFHWESLTANWPAFFTFGEQELLIGAALILPRTKAVIEIATSVPCDDEIIPACESLKSAGYRLSLAGWAGQKERRPLAALCDYLRVDLRTLKPAEQSGALNTEPDFKAMLIAGGVDSWEEHRRARSLGFRSFQGDFFLKPQIFRRREIAGTRRNALRLLQAILKVPLGLPQIEAVVRDEPALTYKLLRDLNSPVMERKVEVRSIRNAISLLGEKEFRRWASLVAVVTPATDKPNELLRTGLTRAYFCEQLALRRDAAHAYDYFFAGLISVMDAVLDRPLEEIVGELALSDAVRNALLGESGEIHEALQAAKAYESGQWPSFQEAMQRLSLPEACAPECFQSADRTTNAILH